MSETRAIVGHARHGAGEPHMGFAPLKLCVEVEGTRYEVACPTAVLGRHSDCELRVAHPEISRHHCQFSFERGEWHVRDLGSLNGIVIKGDRVAEATLHTGDRLRLGCVGILIESAASTPDNDKLRQILDVLPGDVSHAQ
ncbi:MAG TPA: FHA domain-containing protein [Gemmataceae bacterium]|nr:FHA domain-containing protein [Gemmataceae bacterium]